MKSTLALVHYPRCYSCLKTDQNYWIDQIRMRSAYNASVRSRCTIFPESGICFTPRGSWCTLSHGNFCCVYINYEAILYPKQQLVRQCDVFSITHIARSGSRRGSTCCRYSWIQCTGKMIYHILGSHRRCWYHEYNTLDYIHNSRWPWWWFMSYVICAMRYALCVTYVEGTIPDDHDNVLWLTCYVQHIT